MRPASKPAWHFARGLRLLDANEWAAADSALGLAAELAGVRVRFRAKMPRWQPRRRSLRWLRMTLLLWVLLAGAAPMRTIDVCPVDADGQPALAASVNLNGADAPGLLATGCRRLHGTYVRGTVVDLLVTAPAKAPLNVQYTVRRGRNRVLVPLADLVLEEGHGELVEMRSGYGRPPPQCPPGTEGPDAPETCMCVRTSMSRHLYGSCWDAVEARPERKRLKATRVTRSSKGRGRRGVGAPQVR